VSIPRSRDLNYAATISFPLMISPFDAERFEAFLRYLDAHRNRRRRMRIILDNAAYHKAEDLQPCLHSLRHRMSLDYLPPYGPELNPIERVWKLLRRLRLHNRQFPTLDELIHQVSKQLVLSAEPNPVLRKLSCTLKVDCIILIRRASILSLRTKPDPSTQPSNHYLRPAVSALLAVCAATRGTPFG